MHIDIAFSSISMNQFLSVQPMLHLQCLSLKLRSPDMKNSSVNESHTSNKIAEVSILKKKACKQADLGSGSYGVTLRVLIKMTCFSS